MITLTERAAIQVKKVQEDTNASDKSLRVAVVGGGCSGLQYQLGFDDKAESDASFESNGITVLIDPQSATSLNGIEIDYAETLEGSSFVFNNPNATGGCGCGKSFSC